MLDCMKNELESFCRVLERCDSKMMENLGIGKCMTNLENLIAYYETCNEKDRNYYLEEVAGVIYKMMQSLKEYRVKRAHENDHPANTITLVKEDYVFKALFRKYIKVRHFLENTGVENKVSNK